MLNQWDFITEFFWRDKVVECNFLEIIKGVLFLQGNFMRNFSKFPCIEFYLDERLLDQKMAFF